MRPPPIWRRRRAFLAANLAGFPQAVSGPPEQPFLLLAEGLPVARCRLRLRPRRPRSAPRLPLPHPVAELRQRRRRTLLPPESCSFPLISWNPGYGGRSPAEAEPGG